VLSREFRGKFLLLLQLAFAAGRLALHGQLRPLRDPASFKHRLNQAVRQEWVVYAKRPFASPTCVLKYLARYTHGVAISQRRLVALREGQVSFRYKDYADRQQNKVLTLQTPEFIRRFLLHTLPRGFVRIRYYGFLANRQRNEQLNRCRRLLGMKPEAMSVAEEKALLVESPDHQELCQRCPACQHGRLIIIEVVPPVPRLPPRRPYLLTAHAALAKPFDTS
jgi:hypothetical protein